MLSGPCHWDPSRYLTDLAWAVHQPSRNEPSSAPYSGQRPHFRDPLKLSSKFWSVINSVRVIVLLLSSQYHYTFQAAVRSLIGLCHTISSNKLQHSVQAISLCNTHTRTHRHVRTHDLSHYTLTHACPYTRAQTHVRARPHVQ